LLSKKDNLRLVAVLV